MLHTFSRTLAATIDAFSGLLVRPKFAVGAPPRTPQRVPSQELLRPPISALRPQQCPLYRQIPGYTPVMSILRSVCPSVTCYQRRWYCLKKTQVTITKSPINSPRNDSLFLPSKSKEFIPSQSVEEVEKSWDFRSWAGWSKLGPRLPLITNRKSHTLFRLVANRNRWPWMTLNGICTLHCIMYASEGALQAKIYCECKSMPGLERSQ